MSDAVYFPHECAEHEWYEASSYKLANGTRVVAYGCTRCNAAKQENGVAETPTIAWYREAKSSDELIDFLAGNRRK
jgi:hypothetical protein